MTDPASVASYSGCLATPLILAAAAAAHETPPVQPKAASYQLETLKAELEDLPACTHSPVQPKAASSTDAELTKVLVV